MRISRHILKLQLQALNNFDSVNSILVTVGQILTRDLMRNFDSVNRPCEVIELSDSFIRFQQLPYDMCGFHLNR